MSAIRHAGDGSAPERAPRPRPHPTSRHTEITCIRSFRPRPFVHGSSFVGHPTTFVLQGGMKWGRTHVHSRTGVAGLLPLRHLGSTHPTPTTDSERHGPWPSTEPSNTPSTRRTGLPC